MNDIDKTSAYNDDETLAGIHAALSKQAHDELLSMACAENGHAWWKNAGDITGGLTGMCACGSVLHGVDGDDVGGAA